MAPTAAGAHLTTLLLLLSWSACAFGQLRIVGMMEGKLFLAEGSTRNWAQAAEFCRAGGMRLATVDSRAQVALLNSSYDANQFRRVYWTAGRDAQNYEQFLWDTTRAKLPSDLFWGDSIGVQTCVIYSSNPGESTWHRRGCGEGAGSLCEMSTVSQSAAPGSNSSCTCSSTPAPS